MKHIFILLVSLLVLSGCQEDLKLEPESPSSGLTINVTPVSYISGAKDDTVSFIINVRSEKELKAINLEPTITGATNSGFDVSFSDTDPFADHRFGTLQQEQFSLQVKYDYIIPVETGNINLTFNGSDSEGTSSKTLTLNVVPPVVSYKNVVLYHQDNSRTDGFATIDGYIARNLSNYSISGYVIDTIQEAQDKTDIIFLMDTEKDEAMLTCPAGEKFETGATTWPKGKNQTVFKKLSAFTDSDFENLNAAGIIEKTKSDSINIKGTTSITGVKAFDYIGFITSFNSTNSYKTGIIKIKSIHPAAAPWLETPNMAMEMEVKVQY